MAITESSDALNIEIATTVASVRAAFNSGRTRPLAWREAQLDGLIRLLDEGEADLLAAMKSDVGKPSLEAWITDIGATATEIRHVRKNVAKWSKARKAKLPMSSQPGKGLVVPEPLGVGLIIAPWNYPVNLLLEPLAAAVAAGNAVVVKPSELAPATSAVLTRLIRQHLDNEAIAVVEGAVDVSTALLAERFDHIFFTGSTSVGRVVMKAAAEHLTPVTLELGGKSPVIIDESANLRTTARRLVWGKFLNAGQTCVAPDYLLVGAAQRDELLDHIAEAIGEFYGDDPSESADYGRIVNQRHLDRLRGLLDDPGAGTVAIGGESDPATRYLAPTVLIDSEPTASVMQDEIFGPILPVIVTDDLDDAIEFVNARPKPLALYVFSEDDAAADRVISETSSGSVCVNHSILQITPHDLPFGGVGPSGMGRYHGQAGFDAYSNLKAVLKKGTKPDPSLMYPPYGRVKEAIFRKAI